jgi:hypothetical protein
MTAQLLFPNRLFRVGINYSPLELSCRKLLLEQQIDFVVR